jgi:hypothetical protein
MLILRIGARTRFSPASEAESNLSFAKTLAGCKIDNIAAAPSLGNEGE